MTSAASISTGLALQVTLGGLLLSEQRFRQLGGDWPAEFGGIWPSPGQEVWVKVAIKRVDNSPAREHAVLRELVVLKVRFNGSRYRASALDVEDA